MRVRGVLEKMVKVENTMKARRKKRRKDNTIKIEKKK